MCTNVHVHVRGYAGELFAAMRLTCIGGWVSEGKPEEVREVEQSLFSLTSYVVMFLYHITCRRAGVHV